MSISDRLKKWRAYKKLTQKNAGELLGISSGVYQKYEMGLRAPGAEVMEAFLRAGINVNWLLTGKGPMLVADYSTNPSEREIKPVEREITPQEAITASSVDVNRLKLAIEQIEQELVKRRGMLEPAAKARVFVLAYQVLEDEDKEKDRASFEYAQKMITKLMKTVL